MNATAAATVDQPVTLKNPAVLSKTGVNGWQQDTFGGFDLVPPDPSLCAGAGFVVQVVNSQVQISDANLNKLTAPILMESFFGDFSKQPVRPAVLVQPLDGSLLHDRSRVGLRDVLRRLHRREHELDPRGTWNIYFLNLGTSAVTEVVHGLCLADQPNLGWTSTRSRSRRTSSASPVRSASAASVALRTS